MLLTCLFLVTAQKAIKKQPLWDKNGFDLPIVDLDQRSDLQVVVDKEKGQYLGHPTTFLCKDKKTIYCVYPKGHGRGAIILKRSDDGGKTWSNRLSTPKTWETSMEVPTLYPTIAPDGTEYLLMFSGMDKTNRYAKSTDEGKTWSEFISIPNQKGAIVVMSDLIPVKTGKGHYLATYHDRCKGKDSNGDYNSLELYTTKSTDGGLTWSDSKIIFPGTRTMHLCEGGFVRSPDGKTIAILLRENSRNNSSQIMFSNDEGETWSMPKPLPGALSGDRHQAIYLKDGRLFIQFRDVSPKNRSEFVSSPTEGDWVAWIGTWNDLLNGYEGEYRIRFKDNFSSGDTAYPATELLPDGTLVCTTYGHFDKGEMPYILCVRFKIKVTDNLAKQIKKKGQPEIINHYGDKDVRVFDPMNPEKINETINNNW